MRPTIWRSSLEKISGHGQDMHNLFQTEPLCKNVQVTTSNAIAEKTSSSDEECNLIQSFDSCDEFEIMSIEQNTR